MKITKQALSILKPETDAVFQYMRIKGIKMSPQRNGNLTLLKLQKQSDLYQRHLGKITYLKTKGRHK